MQFEGHATTTAVVGNNHPVSTPAPEFNLGWRQRDQDRSIGGRDLTGDDASTNNNIGTVEMADSTGHGTKQKQQRG